MNKLILLLSLNCYKPLMLIEFIPHSFLKYETLTNTCMSRLQFMEEITFTFQMANSTAFLHSGYFLLHHWEKKPWFHWLYFSLSRIITLNWMIFAFPIQLSLDTVFSLSCASSMIISSFSAMSIEFIVLWNLFINSKIILFLPLTFCLNLLSVFLMLN